MKNLFFIICLISLFSNACEDIPKAVDEFIAFVDVKADPVEGLDVTVFVPEKIGGATISGVALIGKDGDNLQFVIHSEYRISNKYEVYKGQSGSAFANFGMSENIFRNTHISISYSYEVSEDGLQLACGPFRQYSLSDLPEKCITNCSK